MKRVLIWSLFLILVSGCQKNPIDYRTKFVGDYNFTIRLVTWTIYEQTLDTTYQYKGRIWYDGDETMVTLDISTSQPEKAKLYEDGSLKGPGTRPYIKGEFESTKKVKFTVSYIYLGGGGGYSVIGEKAK